LSGTLRSRPRLRFVGDRLVGEGLVLLGNLGCPALLVGNELLEHLDVACWLHLVLREAVFQNLLSLR
jgi:hypothetical protein